LAKSQVDAIALKKARDDFEKAFSELVDKKITSDYESSFKNLTTDAKALSYTGLLKEKQTSLVQFHAKFSEALNKADAASNDNDRKAHLLDALELAKKHEVDLMQQKNLMDEV
jgi:chromatin segregation and condensation protein Rec8/ScpA/Scc1 (kleisin family)